MERTISAGNLLAGQRLHAIAGCPLGPPEGLLIEFVDSRAGEGSLGLSVWITDQQIADIQVDRTLAFTVTRPGG